MQKNDLALYYHSSTNPQTVEGIVRIIRESYADPTQFDRKNKHFDSKSTTEDPRWIMVDIQVDRDLEPPVTRVELQKQPGLENMVLFKNSRLSAQPVREIEWKIILGLREKKG
jgi:predicted RNA-binding protein with PUA-like domain